MKFLNTLLFSIIFGVATSSAGATPPTQVGDSFLFLTGNFGESAEVIYLARDGTCELLSAPTWGGGDARSGTYTYSVTPGNPYTGSITLNVPNLPVITYPLEFVTDTGGGGVEGFGFYLADSNSFLSNVSNRVVLRPAESAITGFVIGGNSLRLVLIRAVGPTLANFDVSPVSTNPTFQVVPNSGMIIGGAGQTWSLVTYLPDSPLTGLPVFQYDSQAMSWIFKLAGAFPLNANSNDQVYFGVLGPGAYTVIANDSTVGASGGSALIEVYILPYGACFQP